MFSLTNNTNNRPATRPAFRYAEDVERFLDGKILPVRVDYLPVPASIACPGHCLWVKPMVSPTPGASVYLICDTGCSAGVADFLAEGSAPVECYLVGDNIMIGISDTEEGRGHQLKPIETGLHNPVDLANSRYVGRVVAAI